MKTNPASPHLNIETNFTSRIIALIVLTVLLLLLFTGCKEEPRTSDINPPGTYELVMVDGNSVPCQLTHEGVDMIVKSGSIIINADGTCRSLSTFAVPPHPDVHREVNATYTQSGAELTMFWQGAGMTKGKVDGNQFTMNNEGMIFTYRK